MKETIMNDLSEIRISAAELEQANLNEWGSLELHLLDQAAVVIPGEMTVMELLRTSDALRELSAGLLSCLGTACRPCDNCKADRPCRLMTEPIRPEVALPCSVLEEAGIPPESKLSCQAIPETGEIRVTESEPYDDLTDLRPDQLELLRESGLCLADLEEKLLDGKIVYGGEEKEIDFPSAEL